MMRMRLARRSELLTPLALLIPALAGREWEATALAAKTPAAAKAAIPVKRIAKPSLLLVRPTRGRRSVAPFSQLPGGTLRHPFRSNLTGTRAAPSRKPDYFGAQSRWQPSPSRRDSCPLFHGDG